MAQSKKGSSKELRRLEMKREVEKWKASGLSIYRFCKDNGHSTNTFSYWIKKFKDKNPNRSDTEKPERSLPMVKLPDFFCDDSMVSHSDYQIKIHIRDISVELGNDFSAQSLKKLLICIRQL